MVRENEVEVRTEGKNMLFCTAINDEDGNIELICRRGKKEDSISINSLLSQIYGRNVAVMLL